MSDSKVLKFDLEAMEKCVSELETAISELQVIQDNLQKAMDDMLSASGWDSSGSAEFKAKYDTSWVEGITDRKAVMERMKSHLVEAQNIYRPVLEEAEKLKLDTD